MTRAYYMSHKRTALCSLFIIVGVWLSVSAYVYLPWKHSTRKAESSNIHSNTFELAIQEFRQLTKQHAANDERGFTNKKQGSEPTTQNTAKEEKVVRNTLQENDPKKHHSAQEDKILLTTTMKETKHFPGVEHQKSDRPSGEFVHIFKEEGSEVNATCIDYKVMEPLKGVTKLCLHDKENDKFVSGSFWKGGSWESEHLRQIGAILHSHPGMIFIDIGSHIGVYTMYANKAGNRVIAIDPLTQNVRRLKKAVKLVNQEEKITILLNAVANRHMKLYLELGQTNNIGSTHLVADDQKLDKRYKMADYQIQTILLDDLLQVFDLDNKEVMMKVDVEAWEWKALQGGYEFFRRVNVCYVMMEFAAHSHRPTGRQIVNFMETYNLFPYTSFSATERLPLNDTTVFRLETVFIKNSSDCMRR